MQRGSRCKEVILSTSKYFKLILKRPNEHFSISFSHFHAIETFVQQLRKEKGRAELFLMILIFEASKLRKDFCKTIFVILEVQFHQEGGLRESRY